MPCPTPLVQASAGAGSHAGSTFLLRGRLRRLAFLGVGGIVSP